MDDRRSLPDPRISLKNKSPQAFEGLRHYGPQEVVDALAAILNQITGQKFKLHHYPIFYWVGFYYTKAIGFSTVLFGRALVRFGEAVWWGFS
jgi:hypothetical protein